MVETILAPIDGLEQQEKRACQRIQLNRQVQLTFSNGQVINGLTEDVSLGGLRISVDDINNEFLGTIEQLALLQIKFDDGQLSNEFSCNIVRCESGSICLKLDKKKAASFGMMLTRGTFKQKKI